LKNSKFSDALYVFKVVIINLNGLVLKSPVHNVTPFGYGINMSYSFNILNVLACVICPLISLSPPCLLSPEPVASH